MKKSSPYLIKLGNFQIEICQSDYIGKSDEAISFIEEFDEDKRSSVHVESTDLFKIMQMNAQNFLEMNNSLELPNYIVTILKEIEQIDICFSNGCELIY